MTTRWTALLALALTLVLGSAILVGCGDDDGDESTSSDALVELPAEAQQIIDDYTAALIAGDGEAMLEFVTDDFTFLSYGNDVQERDFRADYVSRYYSSLDFSVEVIGDPIVVGGGDEFIIAVPERATTPAIADGISVMKMVRANGGWLLQSHRFLGEGAGSG